MVRFAAKKKERKAKRKITPKKGLPVMHIYHTHTPQFSAALQGIQTNNKNTKNLGANFGLLLAKKFSQNFFALRFGTQT